jgi:hypothetical protein
MFVTLFKNVPCIFYFTFVGMNYAMILNIAVIFKIYYICSYIWTLKQINDELD